MLLDDNVIPRTVNSQDVIKMSDGHQDVVTMLHISVV